MGKIFADVGSHIKSSFRGAVIGLAAAGVSIEWYIADASKVTHDGKVYEYFALLVAVFILTCIIQGVLFLLCTFSILPKGLKFVLEIIGDFICSALAIIAAIVTASNCGTGLLKECWAVTTRPPIWVCLSMGILNSLVFVLTALKK